VLKLARRGGWLIVLPLVCLTLRPTAWPPAAAASDAMSPATPAGARSVTLAFAPTDETDLASIEGMSVGIMSATQGQYTTAQLLLDISQGARIASSAYTVARPPKLSLEVLNAGARVLGWSAARVRAEDAPALLRPGLLAAQIPGGAAYAGIGRTDDIDGVIAADREGNIAAVSLGSASTLLARVATLSAGKRFVVCDLPGGAEGYADMRALSRRRAPGTLLIIVQRTADAPGHELLWAAVAGLGGSGGELSSQTTNERGLLSAVDLAPTILRHLGLTPIPAAIRGDPLRTDGALDSASLRALKARLLVIGPRRLKALACLLAAWALLLLGSAASGGRNGERRAWAMRVGGLGMLWAPVAVLIGAALEPGAAVEYMTITLACLILGAITDAVLPWPRAPLAPALAAVAALVGDALAGTQLLVRSLLGPDPTLGARFYGFGNELKSGLAVLVLTAVAAALYPTARTRAVGWRHDRERSAAGNHERPRDGPARRGPASAAVAMAGAGIVLAIAEGSARIGAGVGGVVLVSAGTAMAVVMLLPGSLTRRRALIVLVSPVAGLVALAVIDLLTAHGSGHFTGSVLDARSAGDVRDIIVRRYGAAWDELKNHAMPAAAACALLCAGLALRARARLLTPVEGDPAWLAALSGGLAAGVVGALTEDSGPVLLVVAVFTLGCVCAYLWGRPRSSSSPGLAPAGRAATATAPGR
jgi:hypothetical protein